MCLGVSVLLLRINYWFSLWCHCDVILWYFPDADNFEPKLPTTLTSSNKWEGEDEEEIVKVTCVDANLLLLFRIGPCDTSLSGLKVSRVVYNLKLRGYVLLTLSSFFRIVGRMKRKRRRMRRRKKCLPLSRSLRRKFMIK